MTLYEKVKKLFNEDKADDVLSCVEAVLRDAFGLDEVADHIKTARSQLEEGDE